MSFVLQLFFMLALLTPQSLKNIRQAYFSAAPDERQLPAFKTALDHYPAKDRYFYCYLSAYNSLQSKYAHTFDKKLMYFNLCKKQMNQSLELGESFDARFIRFCIQSNTPGILGYKSDLEKDKRFILDHLGSETHSEYKKQVKLFLLNCKTLDEHEKDAVDRL